jgi:chromosome segregation ATPase
MSEENITTTNTDHLIDLGDKLRHAANEIDNIKNSFVKNTEELNRIKTLLDVEKLDEINGIIEKFEVQVIEAEKRKEEAFKGAKKYSEELEKEKERLIKLWDAYKNQEEELTKTESKLQDLEEQNLEINKSKKQLEEDYSTRIQTLNKKINENEEIVTKFNEYKNKIDDFNKKQEQYEYENQNLKNIVKTKESEIDTLKQDIEKYKDYEKYSDYKEKFDELTIQYEKEKERLTKLYNLYEETESECKTLKQENKDWQSWFNSNKEIFDKLFSKTPPISNSPETKQNDQSLEENEGFDKKEESSNETDDKTTKKAKNKKRKLTLRK